MPGARVGAGPLVREREQHLAEADHVARLERLAVHPHAVDEAPVLAAEVDEVALAADGLDGGVAAERPLSRMQTSHSEARPITVVPSLSAKDLSSKRPG